jgi:arsenite/tail-anchored protein-transporting ATPase
VRTGTLFSVTTSISAAMPALARPAGHLACAFMCAAPLAGRLRGEALRVGRRAPRQTRSSLRVTRRSAVCVTARAAAVHVPAGHAPEDASALSILLENRNRRRYVFFTGKGGTGKTSTSAAVAVKMADEGITTLVISTDPAHSLGDALRMDLSDGKLHRVSPELDLYAIESDTSEAVAEFRKLVAGLRVDGTTEGDDGVSSSPKSSSKWKGVARKLGLDEFGDVLDTIPPGADELIALVRVLNLVENQSQGINFMRIIVDCAPSGHTLRLLAFPDFLDKFLTKALALRKKLDIAGSMMGNVAKMFVGNDLKVDVNMALETAAERVEQYRARMNDLADLFRDPSRAEFVVVAIPTVMAVEESKRLCGALLDDGIWVRHLVANQVLPAADAGVQERYLQRLRNGQAREIAFATEALGDEYGLTVSPVFLFDIEVRGVYALRALAMSAFADNRVESYGGLFNPAYSPLGVEVDDGGGSSQFVFVGGKGGVGKTSMSAAMGISLADRGMKTLVISTDPAHSLGDSLDVSLAGGKPIPILGTNENLYAMEIDTSKAVTEFRELVQQFASAESKGVGPDFARNLGLAEFADLLDNAPPGIDELVALTQVVDLVRHGDFKRVVIDTAPTGHCLRLLSFPDFLNTFLGKLIRLKQRLDSTLDAMRNVFGKKSAADAVDSAADRIERFRRSMVMLRDLILDAERTQFVMVTIPTGLAMAESERLVKQLVKDGVTVRNLIVNQVIADDSASTFVRRILHGQDDCLKLLEESCAAKDIEVTRLPYFDTEVRGLPALRALGMVAFRGEPVESTV